MWVTSNLWRFCSYKQRFHVDFNFLDCPQLPIVNEDGILIETKCQAYVFECREHMF